MEEMIHRAGVCGSLGGSLAGLGYHGGSFHQKGGSFREFGGVSYAANSSPIIMPILR